MTTFEEAIKQAREALTALENAKVAMETAYANLYQNSDWDGQSPEDIIEAQGLMRVLRDAHRTIGGVI